MAKLTLSEAARACNVARTTIQRAVRAGRLSLDAEHRVDTAELLRVGYELDAAVLHAASQQSIVHMQQNAAPQPSSMPQQSALAHDLLRVRQERDDLQRERDRLVQQVDKLLSAHQTTQQQLTRAQQMLDEMLHRYDRLLEAPRPAPTVGIAAAPGVSPHRPPSPAAAEDVDRGTMRRRILALLQDHPEGLSTIEIRIVLGMQRSLTDTCSGMLRDGLLQRVSRGRYRARTA